MLAVGWAVNALLAGMWRWIYVLLKVIQRHSNVYETFSDTATQVSALCEKALEEQVATYGAVKPCSGPTICSFSIQNGVSSACLKMTLLLARSEQYTLLLCCNRFLAPKYSSGCLGSACSPPSQLMISSFNLPGSTCPKWPYLMDGGRPVECAALFSLRRLQCSRGLLVGSASIRSRASPDPASTLLGDRRRRRLRELRRLRDVRRSLSVMLEGPETSRARSLVSWSARRIRSPRLRGVDVSELGGLSYAPNYVHLSAEIPASGMAKYSKVQWPRIGHAVSLTYADSLPDLPVFYAFEMPTSMSAFCVRFYKAVENEWMLSRVRA